MSRTVERFAARTTPTGTVNTAGAVRAERVRRADAVRAGAPGGDPVGEAEGLDLLLAGVERLHAGGWRSTV